MKRLWLALLLLTLPALGQAPGIPDGPRVNGVLTTRIDPARPTVTFSWNTGDLPRVNGIRWEIKSGPYSDVHPVTLSDEPLREGKFAGSRGSGEIDLAGLPDGEYYIRYIGMDGKREATLASEAARFIIVAGNSGLPSGPSGPVGPIGPAPSGPPVTLVPDSINLPLRAVQKFWAPQGTSAVSWRVDGSGEIDQSGVYRAPEIIQGGGLTEPVKVVATLSDGRLAMADIMLIRPARFLGVEPSGGEIKAGKSVQFHGQADGMTSSVPTFELVSGPGQITSGGLYRAPQRLESPQTIRVRMTWPGVAKGPVEVQMTVVPVPASR